MISTTTDQIGIALTPTGFIGLDALADRMGVKESTQGYSLFSETGRRFNLFDLLSANLAPPQCVRIVLTAYEFSHLLECLAFIMRFRGEGVPDSELTKHLYLKIAKQGNEL